MPVVIIRSGIALIIAAYLFIAGLSNIQGDQIKVYNHTETKDSVIFYLKTNKSPLEVVVPKDNKPNGKIKIIVRDKTKNTEIEIEQSGEILPENKPYIEEIMKSITHYAKSKPTLKSKIGRFIKDYVNKKL